MEKNNGKWKVVIGSEWDGNVYIFDAAKDAADFAQKAADSQNNVFQDYGTRKVPGIEIEYLTSQKCADLIAQYEEEQRKLKEEKEQEENA